MIMMTLGGPILRGSNKKIAKKNHIFRSLLTIEERLRLSILGSLKEDLRERPIREKNEDLVI